MQFPGNLCSVSGSSSKETKQLYKKPWGIFLFGWLECSELFKSWKRNNKPHPQGLQSEFHHYFVLHFPIQNFSVLMIIKEKSIQRTHFCNLSFPEIKLPMYNLGKAHMLTLLCYTFFFIIIQVLLAYSQGAKANVPSICGFYKHH